MADIAGAYVRISPDLDAFKEELRGELDAATAGLEGHAKIALDTGDTDAKLAETTVEAEATKTALDNVGNSSGGAGSGLRGLGNDASSASHGMGLLASSILAFAPLAPALGGVLGGAFAALPAIFAGVGSGAGALVLGLDGIPAALKAVDAASETTGKSAAQVATDQKNLATALGGLSPAGRDFVAFVHSELLPAFDGLTGKIQSALLPELQTALQGLLPVIQAWIPYIEQAASGIGQLAEKFGQFASSKDGLQIFNTLLSQGAEFMTKLGGAALTFFEAFGRLGSEAGPIVQGIANALVSGANAFDRWTTDGGASKFLAYVEQVGPQVFTALGNIVKTFGDLLKALVPLGGPELQVIDFISKLADGLIKANPQFAAFLITGIGVASMLGKLKSAIEGITLVKMIGAGGFGGVASEADTAAGKVGALTGAMNALKSLGTVAAVITVTYEVFKTLNNSSLLNQGAGIGGTSVSEDQQKLDAQVKAAQGSASELASIAANVAAFNKASPFGQLVLPTAANRFNPQGGVGGQYGPTAPVGYTPPTSGGGASLLNQSLAGAGAPAAAAAQTAAVKAAQAQIVADTKAGQAELNALITDSTSKSLSTLNTALNYTHTQAMNSIVTKLDGDHKTALTAMASQIVAEHKKVLDQQAADEKAARAAAAQKALATQGNSALSTQQGLDSSTSVTALADALQPVHQAALADLTNKLLAEHTKADTSLADRITAANQAAQANLSNLLAQQAEQALQTQTKDQDAANTQQTADFATAAQNLSAAATEMANDVAKAMSDSFSGQVSSINDSSKIDQDQASKIVSAIQDQSQILVDQMAETGLSGLALQEQQAKVALDQLKATDDVKIANDQIALDTAKAADDARIAAAQQHVDDVTIQQAALVAAAQANLDAVKVTTDADNNAAQLSLDIVSLGTNAALQAQVQGDYNIVFARSAQAMQDAADGLSNAQSTQSSTVGAANDQLTTIQGMAAALEAQLQKNLTSDQGTAAIAEANGTAIIDTLTEGLTLQQQQIAATNATTAAVTASNQLQVNLTTTDTPNGRQGVEDLMFQLRLAGAA